MGFWRRAGRPGHFIRSEPSGCASAWILSAGVATGSLSPPVWGIGFRDSLEKSWRWFSETLLLWFFHERWLSLDGHPQPVLGLPTLCLQHLHSIGFQFATCLTWHPHKLVEPSIRYGFPEVQTLSYLAFIQSFQDLGLSKNGIHLTVVGEPVRIRCKEIGVKIGKIAC